MSYAPDPKVRALVEEFEQVDNEVKAEYQTLREEHEEEFQPLSEGIDRRNDLLIETRQAIREDAEKVQGSGETKIGVFKVTHKQNRSFNPEVIEFLKTAKLYQAAKDAGALVESVTIDWKKLSEFLLQGKRPEAVAAYFQVTPATPAIGGPKPLRLFVETDK